MKRAVILGGGIVILVVVLAGAAFVGGQLLTGQGLPGQATSVRPHHPDIYPAKELPQTPADADGVFDHRKDNSIFVGTGEARIMATRDQRGNIVGFTTSHTGPVVEVVVSPQTKVYRDVTQPRPNEWVQQVVEPGSLAEVGQYSAITAWGKKTGDRIIADVLVYTLPPVKGKR
jgi:hypothetical protein